MICGVCQSWSQKVFWGHHLFLGTREFVCWLTAWKQFSSCRNFHGVHRELAMVSLCFTGVYCSAGVVSSGVPEGFLGGLGGGRCFCFPLAVAGVWWFGGCRRCAAGVWLCSFGWQHLLSLSQPSLSLAPLSALSLYSLSRSRKELRSLSLSLSPSLSLSTPPPSLPSLPLLSPPPSLL